VLQKKKTVATREAEQRLPLGAGKTLKQCPNEARDLGWEIKER
jgi:hypothetical protein